MARLRETIPTSSQTSARIDAIQRKRKLRETLWQEGGILKSQHGLARATGVVEEILDHARRIPLPEDRRQASELLDLRLAARIARIILEASLRREESRGAHFREDFPETDDARWLGHLTVSSPQEGEEVWDFEPMLPDTPAMAS